MKSNKYTYFIPSFLYDKRIYDYVKYLVSIGERSYSSLKPSVKDKIVAQIIDVNAKDEDQLLSGGDKFENLLGKIKELIVSPSGDNVANLIEQVLENARNTYEYDLDMLFDEIIEINESARRREAGLNPYIDKVNGELSWRAIA